MDKIIKRHFSEIKRILNNSEKLILETNKISLFLKKKIKSNNKIFVYGNGGSFADASHFVGELTATYSSKKKKLNQIIKYLYMVMVVHLQTLHILLEN